MKNPFASTGNPVVISRASKVFVGFVGALAAVPVAQAFTRPSLLSVVWMFLGIGIVWRLARLRLAVTDDVVVVQNFFEKVTIPIWEAEIEVSDPEAGIMLSDAGGKLDHGGRTLFIKRMWHHDKIAVGVAPRFGPELERISADLQDEIANRRRSGNRSPLPV